MWAIFDPLRSKKFIHSQSSKVDFSSKFSTKRTIKTDCGKNIKIAHTVFLIIYLTIVVNKVFTNLQKTVGAGASETSDVIFSLRSKKYFMHPFGRKYVIVAKSPIQEL